MRSVSRKVPQLRVASERRAPLPSCGMSRGSICCWRPAELPRPAGDMRRDFRRSYRL